MSGIRDPCSGFDWLILKPKTFITKRQPIIDSTRTYVELRHQYGICLSSGDTVLLPGPPHNGGFNTFTGGLGRVQAKEL